MDSLFERNYINSQPLRKYEPLIRYDIDGNPQQRKLLSELKAKPEKVPPPQDSTKEDKCPPQDQKKEDSPPLQNQKKKDGNQDQKRKSGPSPPTSPKRKQQKQTSIMSFFTKK